MLNEMKSDNSVEEVDNSKIIEEETSVDKTPSVDKKELKNYLSSSLFEDVKTIASDELEGQGEGVIEEVELSEAYASTLKDISEHQLINGRVVGMNDRDVLIDIGFKSEGIIDRTEFSEDSLPTIGDQVEVYLEYLEDSSGNTILSKEKADFMLKWQSLIKAYEEEAVITGKIIRRIKGGMIVDLGAVQAFLPGSQLDVRPITDFDVYVDKEIDLRIVKLNEARKNIVVSHKMIIEESLVEQRQALFEEIEIANNIEVAKKVLDDASTNPKTRNKYAGYIRNIYAMKKAEYEASGKDLDQVLSAFPERFKGFNNAKDFIENSGSIAEELNRRQVILEFIKTHEKQSLGLKEEAKKF